MLIETYHLQETKDAYTRVIGHFPKTRNTPRSGKKGIILHVCLYCFILISTSGKKRKAGSSEEDESDSSSSDSSDSSDMDTSDDSDDSSEDDSSGSESMYDHIWLR